MSAPVRRGARTARWTAVAVGVVMVAFVALLATRDVGGNDDRPSALIGKPVPAVVGETLDASPIDLDSYRGRWTVVNFFATWCTPCRLEHPELVRFSQEHAATGDAAVVSIAFEDSPAALREFFDKNGGTWPVVVGDTGPSAVAFGVTGVPESFVIDPEGVVVAAFHGVTADALNGVIDRAGTSP